jgi:hypothetical protein
MKWGRLEDSSDDSLRSRADEGLFLELSFLALALIAVVCDFTAVVVLLMGMMVAIGVERRACTLILAVRKRRR